MSTEPIFIGKGRLLGTWNATTNSGSLFAGDGEGATPTTTLFVNDSSTTDGRYDNSTNLEAKVGDYWRVETAGTYSIDGYSEWQVNDYVVFITGSTAGATGTWRRLSYTDTVSSVLIGQIAAQPLSNALISGSCNIGPSHLTPDGGSGPECHPFADNKMILFVSGAVANQSASFSGSYNFVHDYTTGQVGIGTSVPEGVLHTSHNSGVNIFQRGNNSAAYGTNLFIRKSRGTVTSKTNVSSGDKIGQISWSPYYGDFDNQAASIDASVEGTLGADTTPGRLVFSTTAAGANSVTERMRIDSAGNIGIGTSDPQETLHLASSVSQKPELLIENTNTDARAGMVRFYKSSTNEDPGDELGLIRWTGKDTNDTDAEMAWMVGKAPTVTNSSHNGSIHFGVASNSTVTYSTFSMVGTGTNHASVACFGDPWQSPNQTTKVGIHTSAPAKMLDINARGSADGIQLTWNDADGSATDYATITVEDTNGTLKLATVDSNGTSGHINLMPDGNVGIGTTTPGTLLDVRGPATVSATAVTGKSYAASIITSTGHNLLSAQKVYIYGDSSTNWSEGVYTISGVTTNTFTVSGGPGSGTGTISYSPVYFNLNGTEVASIKDEDNMASNSAVALATQQSIKAYVDAQVTAQDLDFQGDSGGALSIDLDSETLSIVGTANEIETAGSSNTITIGLPNTVAVTSRVGIGTTSPDHALDVHGTTSTYGLGSNICVTGSMLIDSANNTSQNITYTAASPAVFTATGHSLENGTYVAIITDSNNTINGAYKVENATANTFTLEDLGGTDLPAGTSGTALISTSNLLIDGTPTLNAAGLGSRVKTSFLTSVGTLKSLAVAGDLTVDTSTLKVDSSNNRVGIGTDSPQNPLHIVSSTGDAVKIDRAGGVNLLLRNTSASTSFQMTNAGVYGQFSHGGTATMNLKGGSVGIGTTAPAKALDINSADGNNLRLTYNDSDGASANYVDFNVSNSGVLTISPSGVSMSVAGSVLPTSDNNRNLGSDSLRWANVYTGDLHLKNERGDWTVVEEETFLCIINNKTGKKYKMLMEEID